MFLVVGDKVVEGKTVMGCYKINAGKGASRVVFVKVRATGKAIGELSEGLVLSPPEIPYAVPVLAVPFRPQGRKVSHLVAPFTDIPGFSDELDLVNNRVLLD